MYKFAHCKTDRQLWLCASVYNRYFSRGILTNNFRCNSNIVFNLVFTVAMFLLAKVLTALVLVAVLSIDNTAAKCCRVKYVIHHVCLGTPQEYDVGNHRILDFPLDKNWLYWMRNEDDVKRQKCVTHFCADGSYADKETCGVGKCNILGCGCKGGCRQSIGLSLKEMSSTWREEYGLAIRGKHQLKGIFQ